MSANTIFTIGHSNRTLEDFFCTLQSAAISQLIDVRSHPYSRRYPSYNRNTLNLATEDEQIAYCWLGNELGGIRREKPASLHSALTQAGFRAYADYMSSKPFQIGIERLATMAKKHPLAIMCAERDPTQCHRSFISDYLTLHGWHVIHLLSTQEQFGHCLHPLARTTTDAGQNCSHLVYDRLDQEQLDLSF